MKRQFSHVMNRFGYSSDAGEHSIDYVLNIVVDYNVVRDGGYVTIDDLAIEELSVVSVHITRCNRIVDEIPAWETSRLARWTKDFLEHMENDGSEAAILDEAEERIMRNLPDDSEKLVPAPAFSE